MVSISAVFCLLLGVLTFISFFTQAFQVSTSTSFFQDLLSKLFGWGSFFVPFVLFALGLILLGRTFRFVRANNFLGLVLLLVSFSSLAHLLFFRGANAADSALLGQGGGLLGFNVSQALTRIFTFIGAFFVLLALLIISLLILFNTSLEQSLSLFPTIFFVPLRKLRFLIFPLKKDKSKERTQAKEEEKIDPSNLSENLSLRERAAQSNSNWSAASLKLELIPRIFKDEEGEKVSEKSESVPKGARVANENRDETLVQETVKNLPLTDYVWEYPPLTLLSDAKGADANRGDVAANAEIIEKALDSFGIKARVVEVNLGPAVTQYALESAQGTKIASIKNLQNDLAMALASPTGTVRIEAPIPGKSLIGVETPNLSPATVNLRSILSSDSVVRSRNRLLVALGLDVAGQPVVADVARMPHVLMAGSTGSGKSTLIHAILASLLFRSSPEELKLILVDTKRVELTEYNDIPHLLTPVITEAEKVLSALKWAISEMERRYRLFQSAHARNIDSYNELSGFQALPYIVILVDEMADMMQMAPVEVEKTVCRLAQMARATGIHLVLSTQRPSVDVLTGLIKANIPARIAFNVTSQIDSRVIIDQTGAEKLLGRGDMLYLPPESSKPVRIQGVYVSSSELLKLIEFLKNSQVKPSYQEEVVSARVTLSEDSSFGSEDELFIAAVEAICQYDRASASLLQRRLKVGYARAARLLDEMEEKGIVGPADGSKPREVLIHDPSSVLGSKTTEFNKGLAERESQDDSAYG